MRARGEVQKRVQAVGAYGFSNYGDQLFVETVQTRAPDIWPGARVKTFAPGYDSRYAAGSMQGRSLRISATILGGVWADTIALCGGSTLQDVRGASRLRSTIFSWKRMEALGVSIGPFGDNAAEKRVAKLLRNLDRVIVRDKASVERADGLSMAIDVVCGGDLAALSSAIVSEADKSGIVTVCPSAAAGASSTFAQAILEAVKQTSHSAEGQPTLRLLALSSNPNSNDEPLCMEYGRALEERGVRVLYDRFKDLGVNVTSQVIGSSAVVLSQRFHGAVAAYLAGVPFMLEGHHAKCVDFGKDIGVPKELIPGVAESWTAGLQLIAEDPGCAASAVSPSEYRKRAELAYVSSEG